MGKKQPFPTRLILQRVSADVAQKRLDKLTKNAKRNNKWKVTEQRKRACHFNVYVTNLPAQVLAAPHIGLVYSLRWQIELVFKIWKSLFGLDQVKPVSIFRFECLLYGKLIALLLSAQLQNVFKTHLWEEQQVEWSEWKAAKVIKKMATIQKSHCKRHPPTPSILTRLVRPIGQKSHKGKEKVAPGRQKTEPHGHCQTINLTAMCIAQKRTKLNKAEKCKH